MSQCKHLKCSRRVFRRGICFRHYNQLTGRTNQTEKPLTRAEMQNIDPDEFWNWVKLELNIR